MSLKLNFKEFIKHKILSDTSYSLLKCQWFHKIKKTRIISFLFKNKLTILMTNVVLTGYTGTETSVRDLARLFQPPTPMLEHEIQEQNVEFLLLEVGFIIALDYIWHKRRSMLH